MALVCYKEGSNEIVGANFTFVAHKDDHFIEHFEKGVRFFQIYHNEFPFCPNIHFVFTESKSNNEKFDKNCVGTIRKF